MSNLFELSKNLPNGGLHIKHDPKTGLKAIIALYSTKLGPSLGGCRFIPYASETDAIFDATRLARGMAYKTAMAGLPLGGGKGIIIRPAKIDNYEEFLKSYALFVEQMGGNYITAMDSGTTQEDMDIIKKYTNYVTCYSNTNDLFSSDPSIYTAIGVKRGIEATVKFKLGKNSVKDLHIAIQGVGNVGIYLAELLHKDGAKLTVADLDYSKAKLAQEKFGANIVDISKIHSINCDVFSPCALGAIINDESIAELNTKIIAGSANNQLLNNTHGKKLLDLDILYAPDYVISAGGVCFAYGQYYNLNNQQALDKIENIYQSLEQIFIESEQQNLPTNAIADIIAEKRINDGQYDRYDTKVYAETAETCC